VLKPNFENSVTLWPFRLTVYMTVLTYVVIQQRIRRPCSKRIPDDVLRLG